MKIPRIVSLFAILMVLLAPLSGASAADLFADINPGTLGSDPSELTVFNGQLYFIANDGTGATLYRTAGDPPAEEITLPADYRDPAVLIAAENVLYILATDNLSGFAALLYTDGVAAPQLVGVLTGESDLSDPPTYETINDRLFLNITIDTVIWVADPSIGSVSTISVAGIGVASDMILLNGALYFLSIVETLQRIDTPLGTPLLEEVVNIGTLFPNAVVNGNSFTEVGGFLFFSAIESGFARLFRSDGAGGNLTEVITPLDNIEQIDGLTVTASAGRLFFFGTTPSPLFELNLYVINDPANPTFFSVNNFGATASPSSEVAVTDGNVLFFSIFVSPSNESLYTYDPVADTLTTVANNLEVLFGLTPKGDKVYFSATQPFGSSNFELWESDGTAAGTSLILPEINTTPAGSSFPSEITEFGDSLFFVADDGLIGNELYELVLVDLQRRALIDLYNSTDGDNWTNNTGWKAPPLDADGFAPAGTEGTWFGVTVVEGDVEGITLENNNLVGTLPDTLSNLTALRILNISQNQISGPIPATLGDIISLEQLLLRLNQLTGGIPAELGNLTGLTRLLLNENDQLGGTIPATLANLTVLQELGLANCGLTGTIPDLSALSQLRLLILDRNSLTGPIPEWISSTNFPLLESLQLQANQLDDNALFDLTGFNDLLDLSLGGNNLTVFPNGVFTLTSLISLDLSDNPFNTALPRQLENLQSLQTLFLYQNGLTGPLSAVDWSLLADLQTLHLWGNNLTGAIPTTIGSLGQLQSLFLNGNALQGEIPVDLLSLGNLVDGELTLDYNAIFTEDTALAAFIDQRSINPNWRDTQTLAPENLTAASVTDTEIVLTWDPVAFTDIDGGYRIDYILGQAVQTVEVTGKNTVTETLTGLLPETAYQITIRSFTNAHGENANPVESVDAAPITVTTLAEVMLEPGDYYVDAVNGSDENDGTSQATAWQTLHYALSRINGGTPGTEASPYRLFVAFGTYTTSALDGFEPDEALTVTQSFVEIIGQPDIEFEPGDRNPSLEGDVNSQSWIFGLEIAGSHVKVSNLDVYAFNDRGIYITGSANRVEGCRVYDNTIYGVKISGTGAADNTVANCEIFDAGADDNPGQEIGVLIEFDGGGNTVVGNTIRDHASLGVQVIDASPEILRNSISNNTVGIDIFISGSSAFSPRIRNNLIRTDALGDPPGQSGILLSNGSDGGSLSPEIFHNTVDGGPFGISVNGASPAIRFNIISNFTIAGIEDTSETAVVDYNDIYSTEVEARNYLGVEGSPLDIADVGVGNISVDPLYADPANGDFRLSPFESPAIDAIPVNINPANPVTQDIELTPRPLGDGYDMGAYEFGEVITWQLQVIVEPVAGGTVSFDSNFCPQSGETEPLPSCFYSLPDGTTVTLTATANEGFLFFQWEESLDGGSTFQPASGAEGDTLGLVMDADKTVRAVFQPEETFSLQVYVEPAEGGTVSFDGNLCPDPSGDPPLPCIYSVAAGTTVTLTANANVGYAFVQWEESLDGGETFQPSNNAGGNQRFLAMDADKTVRAVFVPLEGFPLQLAVEPESAGVIRYRCAPDCNDAERICPTDCAATIPVNATVTLTATPLTNTFAFSRWVITSSSGVEAPPFDPIVETVNPLTRLMDRNYTITAQFVSVTQPPPPIDLCPSDPDKVFPGICGCGVPDIDSDGDNTPDCNDDCPEDPDKTEPGVCGCGVPDVDSDEDGTLDCEDGCPEGPDKTEPGVCGCGVPDVDSDEDGTLDCEDGCPDDADKTEPGVCGCGVPDEDLNGDGVIDCLDQCPDDPEKTEPGVCGCGIPETDSDDDGTPDCVDQCPEDPAKTDPGFCGCGEPDTDSDGDNTPDCNDQCPDDPLKTVVGACGCGVPDVDTDEDGTPDCNDGCPDDPNKTEPGACGCGVPETAGCIPNQPPPPAQVVQPENGAILPAGTITLSVIPPGDPEGDAILSTTWQVRQFASLPWQTLREAPGTESRLDTPSLFEGIRYQWRVGFQDAGSRTTTWTEVRFFTVGELVDAGVDVPPGTQRADFRAITFPHWAEDNSFQNVLGPIMGGLLDRDNFRIAAYLPGRRYVEYGQEDFSLLVGRPLWFLARNGLDIDFPGVPVALERDIEVTLQFDPATGNGWNLVGTPNESRYDWREVRVVLRDGVPRTPTRIADLESPNDLIDVRLWRWEDGEYADDTVEMVPYEGYWARAKQPNVALIFTLSAQIPPDEVIQQSRRSAPAESWDTPPDVSGGIADDDVSEPASAATSPDGGCFLKSASRTEDRLRPSLWMIIAACAAGIIGMASLRGGRYSGARSRGRWLMAILLAATVVAVFPTVGTGEESVAASGADMDQPYQDYGLYLHENGDYREAESFFIIALEMDPDDPYTRHYLGRTYLRMGELEKAREELERAMAIDPDIPGLRYDLGRNYFAAEAYGEAAERFRQVPKTDPDYPSAVYHAGLSLVAMGQCDEARPYLNLASQLSPSVRAHGNLSLGICYQENNQAEMAAAMFQQVVSDPTAGELKDVAENRIMGVSGEDLVDRPYKLSAFVARFYNDNVRAAPEELDIGADESDWGTEAGFFGKYDFVRNEGTRIGASVNLAQIWHDEISEFDQMSVIFAAYASQEWGPVELGLTYTSAYYRLDDDPALERNQLTPWALWKLNDRWATRLSFSVADNEDSLDADRDGDIIMAFADIYHILPARRGYLYAGAGLENKDATAEDESYDRWRGRIGGSLRLPWRLRLDMRLHYSHKEYDAEDREVGITRDDDRYGASISLDRPLIADWLRLSVGYDYTRNDANLLTKDYEQNRMTLAISAEF